MLRRSRQGTTEEEFFQSHFNTALDPMQEKKFKDYLKNRSKQLGRDVSMDLQDYDLRGAFRETSGSDARGHGTDRFKKPNHPTFSTESIYHESPKAGGGQWVGGRWGGDTFTLSKQMRDRYGKGIGRLKDYMTRVEPKVALLPPLERSSR